MKELVRDAARFRKTMSMLIGSDGAATLRTPNAVDRSMIQILARQGRLHTRERRIVVLVVMVVMVVLSHGDRARG